MAGLFTLFHDLMDYDVEISDSIISNVSVEYDTRQGQTASFREAASILQTTGGSGSVSEATKVRIIRTVLKDVFKPLNSTFLRHDLFKFDKPIASLEIDAVEFIDFHELYEQNEVLTHDQALQKFDATTGPRKLSILNSEFIGVHTVQPEVVRQNLTAWTPDGTSKKRYLFTFKNYGQQALVLKNVTIKNNDFSDGLAAAGKVGLGRGHIFRVSNSQILLD